MRILTTERVGRQKEERQSREEKCDGCKRIDERIGARNEANRRFFQSASRRDHQTVCIRMKKKSDISIFGYARHVTVTFVICQHRRLLIGLQGLIRAPSKAHTAISSWHDSYPWSLDGVTPMEFIRNPGGPYRNTQSICMPVHTYVRRACNTWYNTRDESALSENARG